MLNQWVVHRCAESSQLHGQEADALFINKLNLASKVSLFKLDWILVGKKQTFPQSVCEMNLPGMKILWTGGLLEVIEIHGRSRIRVTQQMPTCHFCNTYNIGRPSDDVACQVIRAGKSMNNGGKQG